MRIFFYDLSCLLSAIRFFGRRDENMRHSVQGAMKPRYATVRQTKRGLKTFFLGHQFGVPLCWRPVWSRTSVLQRCLYEGRYLSVKLVLDLILFVPEGPLLGFGSEKCLFLVLDFILRTLREQYIPRNVICLNVICDLSDLNPSKDSV
jgi:hypothetical protein